MVKLIAFDLDNTLYDHAQYVTSAYSDISHYVSLKRGVDVATYFDWIINRWTEKGSSYNRIFLESYEAFDISGFEDDITDILSIYRSAKPNLNLYKGVFKVLRFLKEKYSLALITDGKKNTQEYKIRELGVGELFEYIYISGEFGLEYYKPSTKLFEMCIKKAGCSWDEVVYVGDNPLLDYPPCRELGIKFVRVLKGEYSNISSEDEYQIREFLQLKDIIGELEN